MSTAALAPRPHVHGVLADRLVPARTNTLLTNVALVGAGAAVVGAFAQLTIPMWPVPITGQTLAVMLVGGALGMRRGAMALTVYMFAGLAGVPWFAEFRGGPAMLLSPTFGYILGFIAAAAIAGWCAERAWDRRPVLAMVGFCLATAAPFVLGVPYLAAVLNMTDPSALLAAGVTPFIVPGLIKAGMAAAAFPLAWRLVQLVDDRR